MGNKCDLPWQAEAPAGVTEYRVVSEDEGKQLVETLKNDGAKASYIETSAKSDINIDELFIQLTKQMYAAASDQLMAENAAASATAAITAAADAAHKKPIKSKNGGCAIL